jgi:hypothetical protein
LYSGSIGEHIGSNYPVKARNIEAGFCKLKYPRTLLLVTIVASLILMALPGHIVAQSASVRATNHSSEDGSGSIIVSISAAEIGAFELNLVCDTTGVIIFETYTAGSGPGDFTILTNITSNSLASMAGFMTSLPINGDTVVATIYYSAVGEPGDSVTVNISGTLYDASGEEISGVDFSPTTVQIETEEVSAIPIIAGGLMGCLLFVFISVFWVRRRAQSEISEAETGNVKYINHYCRRLAAQVLMVGLVISLIGLLIVPVPVLGIPGSFDVVVSLEAETSIALEIDSDNVAVLTVYIDRIKNADTDVTELIPGGIGSYSAIATFNTTGVEVIDVRGVAPYDSPVPVYGSGTVTFSVASVASPEQPNNSPVAKLVIRLNGDCLTSYDIDIAFTEIIAFSDPGLNVPEENPNSANILRGDAKEDGVVNIVDAMFAAQYTVGLRTLSELNIINAACIRHDGTGDIINIVDAMFVAQYTVGLRDNEFN